MPKKWSIMKGLTGKVNLKSSNFRRKITVNEVDIFGERQIATEFNAFFITLGVNWQAKFKMLLQLSNPTLTNQILSWKRNNSR